LIRHKVVRVFLLMSFTLLLTALIARIEFMQFLSTRDLLPKEEAVFSGIALDVFKDSDGSTVVLTKASKIGAKEIFLVRLKLSDALAHSPLTTGAAIRFRGLVQPFLKPLSSVHFDEFHYGLAHNLHGKITLRDKASLWVGEQASLSYFKKLRAVIF